MTFSLQGLDENKPGKWERKLLSDKSFRVKANTIHIFDISYMSAPPQISYSPCKTIYNTSINISTI